MNKLARIESFPGHTLDLIGCWKYIQMVSLFDQLTAPMINLSELIWIECPVELPDESWLGRKHQTKKTRKT